MLHIGHGKKSNRTFISFVVSYVFILMIPYCIGYFAYNASVSLLTQKVTLVEKNAMSNKVEIIEYKVKEFEAIMNQLAYDDEVRDFVKDYNPYGSNESYFLMTRIKRNIESINVNNQMIENVTIFSNHSKYFLSNVYGTVFEGVNGFPYESMWGISKQEMYRMINGVGKKYYFFTDRQTQKSRILMTIPIIVTDISRPEGMIIAELTNIHSYMEDAVASSADGFIILDSEGQRLDNENPWIKNMEFDYMTMVEGAQSYNQEIDNHKLLITHKVSDINQWVYISVADVEGYLTEVTQYKYFVVFVVLISAFMGVLISIYISNLKYKPIRKLKMMTAQFKRAENQEDTAEGTDYQIIENSIFEMVNTMDTYKTQMLKQERKNRNWYFSRLIRGWTIKDEEDSNTTEFHVMKEQIKKNKNRVIIYAIDDVTNLFYESGLDFKEETIVELMSFVIINVLEEYFGTSNQVHVLSLDNRFVITLIDMDNTGSTEKLVDMTRAVKEFLKNHFGIIGSFAISAVHEGIKGIKLGYDNAVEIMEYKTILGDQNTILTFENLFANQPEFNVMNNIEKEKAFVNFILVEDFDQARQTIYRIIDEDMSGVKSLQLLKVKLFGLIDKMLHGFKSISERSSYYGCVSQERIDSLLYATSLPELKKNINEVFDELVNAHEIKEISENTQNKVQDILTYINENYTNPDLTVSVIAEAFDMSVSNLSKFLKKELGQSTLDYIHDYRVNEAKKMLLHSELTLNEIAEAVGYYNYRTLVARFKKNEGITPTQYREQTQ